MRPPQPEGAPPLEISMEELETLVEQARAVLPEDGYKKLLGAVRTLRYVTELLEKKEASLADLRELLCPATTEKTEKVLKQAGIDSGPEKPSVAGVEGRGAKRKARGHGRNGAAAYSGAQRVPVPHASLKPGDVCPDGCGGKVYPQRDPGVLVRIKGQAPLAATVYELEKLRCNLCGKRIHGRRSVRGRREKV
jgi:transposase